MNKMAIGVQLACLVLAIGQYLGKEEHAAWVMLVGNGITLALILAASLREWRAKRVPTPHLDTATGAELDRLGKLYGVRRIFEHNRTESDAQFRRRIEQAVRL